MKTVLLTLFLSAFVLLNLPQTSTAEPGGTPNPVLFPVPESLESAVAFWEKVYSRYTSDEIMIHDDEKLGVIYEVINFNDLYGNPDKVSRRTKSDRIERIKKRYKSDLLRISNKMYKKQPLTDNEQQLVNLHGADASYKEIRDAAYRVRGQQGLKNEFKQGLERSGLYLEHIRDIFSKHKLPPELSLLPHVESSFNYKAYSKYGAAGIWQFTRSTGRLFMKINYDIDERSDPIVATEAAAKLLTQNFSELQSWPLAITAYNHGRAGMKRAKNKFGDDIGAIVRNYSSRSFKFASRNFYAEFIAAYKVATSHTEHFGYVEFESPIRFITFETKKYYSAQSLCKTFNITIDELKEFNPALRSPILLGQRRIPKGYKLRIPDRLNVDEESLWSSIEPAEKFDDQIYSEYYKVMRGDNLSIIARRTRTSISDLMAYNDLSSKHRIYVGQIIKIPSQGSKSDASTKSPVVDLKPTSVIAAAVQPDQPKVQPVKTEKSRNATESDGYFKLADGLSTPGHAIAPPNMRTEFVARDETRLVLVPQQEPVVEANESITALEFVPEPPTEWITVEPEETIGHFADWLEVSAQELRRINDIPFGGAIHVGQKMKLTYRKVDAVEFQRRRFEYQRSIEEDFFSTFAVDTVITHAVKRGQSIWSITNSVYDVPLWLVMKYNPDNDLQDLHVGDQIKIPMLVERTASKSGA
ncbi:LysM peptidoglycan-binding domain-containing protein [candidate division KSB1 bacterium]|nr:LysM peptidoglycan-binding domain-containing protein [candidate division KSB1 bacterium]